MTNMFNVLLNSIKGPMSKAVHLLKRSIIFLIKMLYLGSFFVIVILLLKMIYFPHSEQETPVTFTEYTRNDEMIKRIANNSAPISRGHFHIIDENVFQLESNPPVCLKCHGIYPHIKAEKTLSFLNLHTGFMACEVCHIRKGPKDMNHFFTWVDLDTGKTSMQVKGGYGKYRAKIIPIKNIDGHLERLDQLANDKFSQIYSKLEGNKYTPEQHAGVMKIHKSNLSKNAASCPDCHKKYGYLNYKKLGFPQYRINQLISSEIPRMVEHYKTFYMPKMLVLK